MRKCFLKEVVCTIVLENWIKFCRAEAVGKTCKENGTASLWPTPVHSAEPCPPRHLLHRALHSNSHISFTPHPQCLLLNIYQVPALPGSNPISNQLFQILGNRGQKGERQPIHGKRVILKTFCSRIWSQPGWRGGFLVFTLIVTLFTIG